MRRSSKPTRGATGAVAGFVAAVVAGLVTGLVSLPLALSPSPVAAEAAGPAAFTPVLPCRLVDTRHDQPQHVASGTIRLQVTGNCGVPAGASAVALTVVATDTDAAGYVAAYPSSSAAPLASTLNYTAGDTRANGTIVALSPSGQIDVAASSAVQLVIDTTGYFSAAPGGSATSGRFVPLTPTRLTDTRSGSKLAAGAPFTVGLPAGVPADALAVAVNLTAVEPEQTGFLTVYAAGTTPGVTSVLNYPAASAPRAATVIVPVSAAGFVVRSEAATHLLVDITGYFTGESAAPSSDGLLVAMSPTRLLDTRTPDSPLFAQGAVEIAVPSGAVAVLNVTMLPSAPGFLSALPAGTSAGTPGVSSVNAGLASRPVANMAITPVSVRGVELWSAGLTHAIVDLEGWFTGTPGPAPLPARPNVRPPNPAVGGCLSGPAERDKTGRWLQQTVNKWSKIGYYSGFGDKGPLVIVGDSLTWQSIIPAMNTFIDAGYGPICLDGVISRNTLSGSSSITSARSAVVRIKGSHPFWTSQTVRWVVGLGTNDIASTGTSVGPIRQRIDGLMADIGSTYFEVGWVNLRTRRAEPWITKESAFNAQLAVTGDLYVIDWATLVAPSPPTYIWQADLIHLTVVGQQARSELTVAELARH